ncbi:hypothetical protein BDV27DRAFT_153148 [Aspergillus caelatus]|uniref:F-box domain-containing protein n=1 Tax=Aspergillus caelatus TaxID=61420 RepID=A0A5N7AJC4_9EURO|nr:uncharacterized protein BDV27DRAFT_153148 [Aspergillus caelatus]KAE8369268.1 hypothetical protein BDV27DRAFT_153148 [Aspergillus caelatus]
MVANSYQSTRSALLIAEIVALIIENVDTASDLLACARVNTSRQRFVQNMSFVKHLLVAPEQPAYTNCGGSCGRPKCFEKPRMMRHREESRLLLRAQPKGISSIMIPFELVHHNVEYICDYLGQESIGFLAINNHDCTHIVCYKQVGGPNIGGVQFPRFKELQIIKLLPHPDRSIFSSRILVEAVAKCKNLRAIDIPALLLGNIHGNYPNIHFLLDIARGCPLLQKLSVGYTGVSEVNEPLLLDILKALPRLEFLKLGSAFRMYGTELQDLAQHCPRLTFLELPSANLYISLAQLTQTLPFHHLEIIRFENIFLKNPRHIRRGTKFQTLVTEWSRIFPKLRTVPFVSESDAPPALREILEQEGPSVSSHEEPPSPDSDEEDLFYSDWHRAMLQFCEALNYRDYDDGVVAKLQYMWETNMEIETFGWPVLSSGVIIHPFWHSTSRVRYSQ